MQTIWPVNRRKRAVFLILGIAIAVLAGFLLDHYIFLGFGGAKMSARKALSTFVLTEKNVASTPFAIYAVEMNETPGFIQEERLLQSQNVEKFWRSATAAITNNDIDYVDVIYGTIEPYELRIILTHEGGETLRKFSTNNRLAIYLNGKLFGIYKGATERNWMIGLDGFQTKEVAEHVAAGLVWNVNEKPPK
jgi:hypothetical protein